MVQIDDVIGCLKICVFYNYQLYLIILFYNLCNYIDLYNYIIFITNIPLEYICACSILLNIIQLHCIYTNFKFEIKFEKK